MSAPASVAVQKPIAVIGGGITGLTAAYKLTQAGRTVRLFEAGPRLGGAIGTEQTGGWLIEAGPNSFQENSSEVAELLAELGLEAQRVVASPLAKKRFIVRGGRLQPVPLSPPALLSTPLFSLSAKIRLLAELATRPRQRTSDVSLAEMVRDHFGQEIVDYALNPFVSGVYAGDPKKLSARHAFPKLWDSEQKHGSLLRGQIAQAKTRRAEGHPKSTIISFRHGLQSLVETLEERLKPGSIELLAKIVSFVPGSPWRLVWSRNDEIHTEEFGAVLLAIPAAMLARLEFGALAERPLALLDTVNYPPVASLFLGFRREQISHPLDGFGALVPAAEKRDLLGVLFSSSLFPGRAPDGCVALTVMVGGALRPELAHRSIDEMTSAILPELESLLGLQGTPVFRRLHCWPRAIPQYQLGYERILDAISTAETRYPRLLIGGNVRDGIALPSCIESGMKMARQALKAV